MYTSLKIRNFRCFSSINVKKMGRINIFTGKNGSGKTTILEALWLNRGYHNPELPLTIENFRGLNQFKTDEFLNTLFSNFNNEREIVIEVSDQNNYTRTLEISSREPTEYEKKFIVSQESEKELNGSSNIQSSFIKTKSILIKSMDSNKRETIAELTLVPSPEGQTIKFIRANRSSTEPTSAFLSSLRRVTIKELAERLSSLIAIKDEESIVNILQIIDKRIKNISIEYSGGEPGLLIDVGKNRLYPISLLGDGLYRFLTIALFMSTSKNGEILIDEIENGLHYSVFESIWRVLDDLSKQFNVQVFVTTHSQECIKSAVKSLYNENLYSEKQTDIFLHRMDKEDDNISIVTYSLDELANAIEMGLEIR